jgi:hypothetical protein
MGDLTLFHEPGKTINSISNAHQSAAVEYIKRMMRPDDIVICAGPHLVDHYLGRDSDYWLQTLMQMQASLGDSRPLPLHRLKGVPDLPHPDQLKAVFATNKRIWYIVESAFNGKTNVDETSEFIRSNMDLVYEGFDAMVFFRGPNHRPADVQSTDEQALDQSHTTFLP